MCSPRFSPAIFGFPDFQTGLQNFHTKYLSSSSSTPQ
uniref:Uncharacterized protein n=1 Tax=Arundo donax TaxID=35708 RepID=A0A0A9B5I8_ARUDO